MSLRHNFLPPHRLLATGLMLSTAAGLLAEPIRFSRPAVPIAMPAKAPSKLPQPREKGLDFTAPDPDQQRVAPLPQQPVMRTNPREEKTEDELPALLRTPKMFSDPDEEKEKAARKNSANPLLPGRNTPRLPWQKDPLDQQRADGTRALSPVTDLEWDARDANGRPKDSAFGGKPGTRERKDERTERTDSRARNPYGSPEDANARFDAGRPSGISDMFNARNKEKLSPAQLERRTAFEELLNPSASSANRVANPLQPVVNAADARPGNLAIPTVAAPILVSPTDPMTALNKQQQRLGGPVLENVDRRYAPSAARSPGAAANDPNRSTPLNRQPGVHEFPSRKF